jgi:hypothetical protein
MSDDRGDNQPNEESMQELTLSIKMSIEQVHTILGHSSKGMTQKTAEALGILIMRGALKTCKSCAIAKAKQKNVNDESEGEKIVKNGKDGKVGDRGITMVFVGYADGHARNCYRMYNPVTTRLCVT